MTNTNTTTGGPGAPQMEQLDPAALLVDVNVRRDATPDKTLIESVRDLGVLVPLVAVRDDEGVRVRYGHRRAQAAVEAGQPTVPVWVFQAEATGTEVDRIVRQWAENEHREALTDADRLGVVEQLSAFGVTAAQITKRLKAPRKHVDAALSVAKSTLAKAAVDRYGFLDLTQAAVIAEFDATEDSDTVKALVVAAKESPGQFPHIAQRARDAAAERARRQAARDTIAATGVTVLDGIAPSRWSNTPVRLLSELTDGEGQTLTATAHATCPGHAAYLIIERGYFTSEQAATVRLVDEEPEGDDSAVVTLTDPDGYQDEYDVDDEAEDDDQDQAEDGHAEDGAERPVWRERFAAAYVCTEFSTHGHVARWTGHDHDRGTSAPASEAEAEAQKEAARAERKQVIDNNRSWVSATTVRQEFLRTLLRRKTAPKGAAAFVARSLIEGNHAVRRAMEGQHTGLADLLGIASGGKPGALTLHQPMPVTVLDGASEARAQVLALAVILAAYEAATGKHSWRTTDRGTARYLHFLTEHGYDMSDVERLACGQTPLPYTPADAEQAADPSDADTPDPQDTVVTNTASEDAAPDEAAPQDTEVAA